MSSDVSPRLNPNSHPGRKLKNKSSTKWLVRSILLLLLTAIGLVAHRFIFAPRIDPRSLPTTPVVKATLPLTVSANALIEPKQSINVSPKTAGILKTLLVDEGDRVKAGQIIAYMDDSNLQGQKVEAEGKLAAAVAKLQKLEAGNRPQEIQEARAKLDEMQAKVRQAELTLAQDERLYQSGAISERDVESSRSDRDSLIAQVEQAQQSLSLKEAGSRVEEIAEARAEVIAAKGTLQNIQSQLDDAIIRAPFSGIVTRKFTDPGAFVTPSTAASAEFSATSSSILSLAAENRVAADVSETNISKIKIGQSVIIQADAYPGKIFGGKVTEIAPQSTVEMNVTSFEVKISLSDPENLLRAGMNADVEFQVGQISNALVVPTVAIVREEQGTGVYITTENEPPEFKSIQTGVIVGSLTEVESGVSEGDLVVLGMPKQDQDDSKGASILQGPAPPPAPPSGNP